MRRATIFLVIASLLGGMMAPVRFVPNTDAPTHLGNFRDAFTSGIVAPAPLGVEFLNQVFANALISIEAGWGADLNGEDGLWDWHDITGDARIDPGVVLTFGRADETSQTQPANATFTLDNTTGAYSPGLATGVNYPYVRLNTPIRVRVSLDAGNTWTTRFLGFANGFTPSWDISGNVAVVSVSASGRMRRFGRDAPLKSPLRRYLEKLTHSQPTSYWPLEDGVNSTTGANVIGNGSPFRASNTQTLKFGQVTDTPAGSSPLPDFTSGMRIEADTNATGSGNWAIQWVQRNPTDPDAVSVEDFPPGISVNTTGTSSNVTVSFFADPSISVTWVGAGGIIDGVSIVPADTAFDGLWHTYRLEFVQGVGTAYTVNFYIDGTGTSHVGVGAVTIGRPTHIGLNTNASQYAGSIGHIALWSPIPEPQANEAATYSGSRDALDGYVGESATDRLIRLCGEENIPLRLSFFEDFEDGSSTFPMTGSWIRDNGQAHGGLWSLRSAPIPNSGTSDVVVDVPDYATSMSLWYKTSSEDGFDEFRILLDGSLEFSDSGEVDWDSLAVDVTGISQVTLRYVKNSSGVSGSDAVWVDDLSFSISPVLMGAQTPGKFLDLLRECESADHGVLYDGSGPGLSYLTRDSLYNAPASMTLSMLADVPQVAPPFEPVFDDQRIRNVYTVSRKDGSSATFEQVTGPRGTDTVGVYEASATLTLSTDAVTYEHAGWLTHYGTIDGFRYPTLNMNLLANPELAQDWLDAGLFSRIDVTNVSSKALQHPPEDVSLILEGYTEFLTPFDWSVTANCSPYGPNVIGVLNSTVPRPDCAFSKLSAYIPADVSVVEDFENGVGSWTTTSCTFVSSSSITGVSGALTGLMTVTGSPSLSFVRRETATTPGQIYSTSVWCYSVAGYADVGVSIDWYDASHIYISTSTSGGSALSAGVWSSRTSTGTAPAGAYFAQFGPTMGSSPTAGTAMFVDLATFSSVFTVAVFDDCAWTHSDGDYPITIDGEDMTVTAVGSVSGTTPNRTQTFTVTRSLNGVVRSHSAGAEVHVKYPFVLAL